MWNEKAVSTTWNSVTRDAKMTVTVVRISASFAGSRLPVARNGNITSRRTRWLTKMVDTAVRCARSRLTIIASWKSTHAAIRALSLTNVSCADGPFRITALTIIIKWLTLKTGLINVEFVVRASYKRGICGRIWRHTRSRMGGQATRNLMLIPSPSK